jgi:hypothetical protein
MRIAVICWGSLFWDKGCLKTSGNWKDDGPQMPLEFCRISSPGKSKERVTLALSESSAMVPTYWDVIQFQDAKSAKKNLRDREGCPMGDIHSFGRNQNPLSIIDQQIEIWLKDHSEVDLVIWTGLTSNWTKVRNTEFSITELVKYLDSKKSNLSEIKQYFQRVPAQVQTEGREAFMKWCK